MRPSARAALVRFSALLSAAAFCRILHAACVGVSAGQSELPANVIAATASVFNLLLLMCSSFSSVSRDLSIPSQCSVSFMGGRNRLNPARVALNWAARLCVKPRKPGAILMQFDKAMWRS
jgi:hypothetical protein